MMTSLGIWSCQWRELRPIIFGGSSTAQREPGSNAMAASASEADDEEQGYGRGRGRGRGRDGAGEYKMVDMNGEGEAA
jgi:protein SYS1